MHPALHVIVTSAGESRRFGHDKLFTQIGERPLLFHTLSIFSDLANVRNRIVTLSPANLDTAWPGIDDPLKEKWEAIPGDSSRQGSVRQGLLKLKGAEDSDLVIIHDGARPALQQDDLARVVERAADCGAALAATPVRDTLKRGREGIVTETIDRREIYHALTPQIARYDWLMEVFNTSTDLEQFTDEAGMLEKRGKRVELVLLEHANPKVTFPSDFKLIDVLLKKAH